MEDNSNFIGNSSTVIKFIGMTIAGWVISLLASKGLNLGVDATALGEIIGAFIGLGFGYIDAKYHNNFSFLGNGTVVTPEPEGEEDGEDYA